MLVEFDKVLGHANYHNAKQYGEKVCRALKNENNDPEWIIIARKDGKFFPAFYFNHRCGFTEEAVLRFPNVVVFSAV